jgi:tetratricopeptide (TPR) repeat protein
MGKMLLMLFFVVLLPYGQSDASSASSASQEYRTANKLFAAAQFQDALALYQKVLSSPPEGVPLTDVHTRIGDSYFRLGSYEQALTAYRAALEGQKESEKPASQYWIGLCCLLLGRNAEAVDEFIKIPRNYPQSGMWVNTAYYWAGRASERLGKTQDAAKYYRKAGGAGRSMQGKFAMKKAETVKRP